MVQSKTGPVTVPRSRIRPAIHTVTIALSLLLVGAVSDFAAPLLVYDNSLWVGTDDTQSRNVLNMDRTGVLLRSVGPVECTGFAINRNAGVIYFGTSAGGITTRDLNTLATGASFSVSGTEDMTFDGTYIWRAGTTGPNSSNVITRIDPVAHTSTPGFTVPFQALGIAWDGSGFWVAEFATNGLVQRFDASGNPTGQSFHTSGGFVNGGLAYDTTNNTLFIGTYYTVYHYSQAGTQLGSFSVDPSPTRFVDGLEFEGAPTATGVTGSVPPIRLSLSVSPNPSRGAVKIAMELPGPGQLRIYNVTGTLVREMRNLPQSGRGEVYWDGRDEAGTDVPSGVYFARLKVGASSEVCRFSLVR